MISYNSNMIKYIKRNYFMKRNNKNNTEVQYTIFQIIFKRIDLYREHDQTQAHKKHLQAKVRDQRPDKKDSARKRKFNMKASRSSDFNIAQADERTPPHSPSFQIVNMVVYVSACVCVDTPTPLSGFVNKVSGIRVSNLSRCFSHTSTRTRADICVHVQVEQPV